MDKLLRSKKNIILFIAPAFILFTFVLFVPICQSIYYSFCDYKGLTPPVFTGLKNYKALLHDKTLRFALKNSIFFLIFLTTTANLSVPIWGFDEYNISSACLS